MLEFIVTNLPIVICVVAGLALLIVEVFLPGFGVPGISGIALLVISMVLLWIEAGPLAAMALLAFTLALVAIVLSFTLRSASKGKLSKSPMILHESERPEEGYLAANDLRVFIGREGVAQTVLRPSGIAEFDGVRLNVVTDGTFLKQDTKVRIERVEGSRVVVREV